jgi:ribonuclease HI
MPGFYAIKKGLNAPKIVNTWDECQKMVNGYPGAIFKKFSTKEEAKNFILGQKVEEEELDTGGRTPFFTDGSFKDGNMGFAVVRADKKQVLFGPLGKTYGLATSQRAELSALLHAVIWIKKFKLNAIIYTDSEYSLKTLTIYIPSWIQKYGEEPEDWKTSTGTVPANLDILLPILERLKGIKLEHVKAHQGNKFNEHADDFANRGRENKEVIFQENLK